MIVEAGAPLDILYGRTHRRSHPLLPRTLRHNWSTFQLNK